MVFFSQILSQSTRQRLLDDVQQHVVSRWTSDPAMPQALRTLIEALIRIFWEDIVLEIDQDDSQTPDEFDGEDQETPEIAKGLLQVLVVEARDLAPVHGIGTNPCVRGILGQSVRRSRTAWSTLRPVWNCLMEFPVVAVTGNLYLEVVSRAPLFGGDTRLGFASLPLADLIPAQSTSRRSQAKSRSVLAYRREPLAGTSQGELVLILDYKQLEHSGGPACCSSHCWAFWRWAAHFRAFFLYHYWPCDKSLFQMYLKEPVDIALLAVSLSPFSTMRAIFYTVLLICLCAPWPPDEYQIIQFILAFKGTAIITDGVGHLLYGIFLYYRCLRNGTCLTGSESTPGNGVGLVSFALDLYQEVLVWCVCFIVLPRTVSLRERVAATPAGVAREAMCKQQVEQNSCLKVDDTGRAARTSTEDREMKRGGRIKALLKYNLICFAVSFGVCTVLSAFDLATTGKNGGSEIEVWARHIRENVFWCRVLFSLSMFPFLFLMHPQINKLLTHSTPTGYTRLGTLRRYNPRLRPRQRSHSDQHRNCSTSRNGDRASTQHENQIDAAECAPQLDFVQDIDDTTVLDRSDPVEDLKAAVRRFPGGWLAVRAGEFGIYSAGTVASAAGAVISLEIRAASTAVSLGLRAADSTACTACRIAQAVPGSGLVMRASSLALGQAQSVAGTALASATSIVRQYSWGSSALDASQEVLHAVGFLAAAAESPALATETSPPTLLRVGSERAESLKIEAATRLAKMLTQAEQLAEREAAEVIGRVRPEIEKISRALNAECRSHGFKHMLSAGDALRLSMTAWGGDAVLRLDASGRVFFRTFSRELKDLNAQRSSRGPGWTPVVEAYCRLMFSSICEAFLELQDGHALRAHAVDDFTLNAVGPQVPLQNAAAFTSSIDMCTDGQDKALPSRRARSHSPGQHPVARARKRMPQSPGRAQGNCGGHSES